MANEMTPMINQGDDRFFEILTKVVFYTGFQRGVVERRWTHFQAEFLHFRIDQVANFDELDVERLLAKDSPIVRNARKVKATIENARICQTLIAEHGSLAKYLHAVTGQEKRSPEGEFRRAFRLVGESAARSLVTDLRLAALLY